MKEEAKNVEERAKKQEEVAWKKTGMFWIHIFKSRRINLCTRRQYENLGSIQWNSRLLAIICRIDTEMEKCVLMHMKIENVL